MTTTTETITSKQIAQLRREAFDAGDTAQVRLCDRALAGEWPAIEQCAKAIAAAEAQRGS